MTPERPTHLSAGGERRGLKSQLRAGTCDEGQQLLQPEAPVQLKPDPKGGGKKPGGKKPDGEKKTDGEVDELRKENAGLKDRVTTLEGSQSKQQDELDRTNATMLMLAEQSINARLGEIVANIGDADAALTGLEALVEGTLGVDDQRREKDEGVDKSIKAHKASVAPGFLDGLSMILDFANLLKTGLTLSAALGKKLPQRSTALEKGGAGLDMITAGVGGGKDVAEFKGARDESVAGDSMVGMINAIDAKVDAVEAGVESLREHQFGKEKYAVGSALARAVRARDGVQDSFEVLGENASKDLVARAEATKADMIKASNGVAERLGALVRLLRARDPGQGGGGELSKGSTGRSVFDLVARDPEACTLLAETTLVVRVKSPEDYTTPEERSGFWLRVSDPALRGDLNLELFAHQAYPVRPGATKNGDLYVPPEVGRPLSTLVGNQVNLPFERVQLHGWVNREWATRAEWETHEHRQRLLTYEVDPATDRMR